MRHFPAASPPRGEFERPGSGAERRAHGLGAALRRVLLEVRDPDADRVANADVRERAAVDKAVGGRAADAQQRGDLGHRQQLVDRRNIRAVGLGGPNFG